MKNKMWKKLAAAGSAAALVLSLGTAALAAEEPVIYDEADGLKIGYVGWGFTDTTATFYLKCFEQLKRTANVDYELSDNWGKSCSADDVVEVIPTLAEAGCQGLICHSMSAKIVELCDKYNMYYALSGETIVDEELLEMCKADPYCVAIIPLDDYNGGYAAAQYLIEEKGAENICYERDSNRTLEENRMAGAKQACEDLGANWLAEYTGPDYADAIRDFVTSYPEMDALMQGNGSSSMAENAVSILKSMDVAGDVMMSTICNPVNAIGGYLDEGSLTVCMGGEGYEPELCSYLLINAMTGNRIDDEPFFGYVPYFKILTKDESDSFATFYSADSETLPVTDDYAAQNFLKVNNPELDNEWLTNWLTDNYNIQFFSEVNGLS